MAAKLSSFAPITHVLIVRDANGKKVNGTSSRGDLNYAKGLACSLLRLDRSNTYVSVDLYPYDAKIPWKDFKPDDRSLRSDFNTSSYYGWDYPGADPLSSIARFAGSDGWEPQ